MAALSEYPYVVITRIAHCDDSVTDDRSVMNVSRPGLEFLALNVRFQLMFLFLPELFQLCCGMSVTVFWSRDHQLLDEDVAHSTIQ